MTELVRLALHPVHVEDRISIVYLERGILNRSGHALVVQQGNDEIVVPIGMTAVVMLGPGVTVTHAAVALCAAEGAQLLWTGEGCVRLYAAGLPRGRAEPLMRQAVLASDPSTRLAIARRMFKAMFGADPPPRRSIEQLRGIEGAKVKQIYAGLAAEHGLEADPIRTGDLRRPIAAALAGVNAALYGITEAVILALGYSPSIGFVHSGDPRSFVFDVADTLKFKTVVPLAFKLVKESSSDLERRSRIGARQIFYEERIASRLVTTIEEVLRADGLPGH